MRIKSIIILLVSFISIQFVDAQSSYDKVTTLEIVRLVTDANFMLNRIYAERVSGNEDEQAKLRKSIYAANNELMSIRSKFEVGRIINKDRLVKLQKPIIELHAAVISLESAETDTQLIILIDKIALKAKTLKKQSKKALK